MTLLEWIAGGGLVATGTAAVKLYLDLRAVRQEDRTEEKKRYDDLWDKFEKLGLATNHELEDYRKKFSESEQQRIHEGEVCEKRIREVRRESQTENDELRTQVRQLSRLCHSQQLEIDQGKNDISLLKAQQAAAGIVIAGGRRAGDPPPVDVVTPTTITPKT